MIGEGVKFEGVKFHPFPLAAPLEEKRAQQNIPSDSLHHCANFIPDNYMG